MSLPTTGIYLIVWTSGGCSQASVYVDSEGKKWLAPANWVGPRVLSACMRDIKSIIKIDPTPEPSLESLISRVTERLHHLVDTMTLDECLTTIEKLQEPLWPKPQAKE